ncbi:hypothetical protein Q5752_002334 [Cryptotrichosporon argae]
MPQILWGRFLTVSALIIGAGYGIMKSTTPSEEKFYDSLSPELKKKVDQVRAQRAGSSPVAETLANAGDKNQVVWAEELGRSTGARKV